MNRRQMLFWFITIAIGVAAAWGAVILWVSDSAYAAVLLSLPICVCVFALLCINYLGGAQ